MTLGPPALARRPAAFDSPVAPDALTEMSADDSTRTRSANSFSVRCHARSDARCRASSNGRISLMLVTATPHPGAPRAHARPRDWQGPTESGQSRVSHRPLSENRRTRTGRAAPWCRRRRRVARNSPCYRRTTRPRVGVSTTSCLSPPVMDESAASQSAASQSAASQGWAAAAHGPLRSSAHGIGVLR
jgi:hypothetical protein